VSNLSENVLESDLQELFKPFGPIQRVFLAKDKVKTTSVSYILDRDSLNQRIQDLSLKIFIILTFHLSKLASAKATDLSTIREKRTHFVPSIHFMVMATIILSSMWNGPSPLDRKKPITQGLPLALGTVFQLFSR